MNSHDDLVKAFKEVISLGGDDGVMLVSRVPLICKDIAGIKEDLGEIKDGVKWSTRLIWIATGAVGILTPWAWWLTQQVISTRDDVSPAVKLEIQAAVTNAFDQFDHKVNP